jgi:hypothetical protein
VRELRGVLGELFQIDAPTDSALDAAFAKLVA